MSLRKEIGTISLHATSRLTIFLLFLGSCIEPYNYEAGADQFQQTIVVEGMITDQPGNRIQGNSHSIAG
jgi:hypothetical protein